MWGSVKCSTDDPKAYGACPFVISRTCKHEDVVSQKNLIERASHDLIDSQAVHRRHLYCISSDGDSRCRRAMALLTLTRSLPPTSPIFPVLLSLRLFNLLCGNDDLNGEVDWKHVLKRFCNGLLRLKRLPLLLSSSLWWWWCCCCHRHCGVGGGGWCCHHYRRCCDGGGAAAVAVAVVVLVVVGGAAAAVVVVVVGSPPLVVVLLLPLLSLLWCWWWWMVLLLLLLLLWWWCCCPATIVGVGAVTTFAVVVVQVMVMVLVVVHWGEGM
jgi:hypothetical protein